MTPEYFHTRLTYEEARDYIDGVNRRYRSTYEAARMVHGVVGGLFAKNYKVPQFPWDKKAIRMEEEITAEELEALKNRGRMWAKEKNKKSNF